MDEEELELKLDELCREFHEDCHSTQLQSMEEELVLREEQFNAIQAFLPRIPLIAFIYSN